MSKKSNQLVTISQAAKKLKVSTKTLRRWEAAGKITSIRTKGGHRRYDLFTLKKPSKKKASKTIAAAPILIPPTKPTPIFSNLYTPPIDTTIPQPQPSSTLVPNTQPKTHTPSPRKPQATPDHLILQPKHIGKATKTSLLALAAIISLTALTHLAHTLTSSAGHTLANIISSSPLAPESIKTYLAQNQKENQDTSVLGATVASTNFNFNVETFFNENAQFLKDATVEGDLNVANNINFTTDNTSFTSQPDYIIASDGIAIGGQTTYGIDQLGAASFTDLTATGQIDLGVGTQPISLSGSDITADSAGQISIRPNSDTDDYIYFSTQSDQPGFFFAGIQDTNDAGLRINATSGEIEYRDENELAWTPLDTLEESSDIDDLQSQIDDLDSNSISGLDNNTTTVFTTGGRSIRVYDSTGTDYIDIAHDGTDATITTNGTGVISLDNDLQLTGSSTVILPNSNTISGVSGFTQLSGGLAIGGGTTYTITSTGDATLNSLVIPDGGIIDLSAVAHDDGANQGLRLPVSTSLTALSSGDEGFIAWDDTNNRIVTFDGTSWTNISGASTTLEEAYQAGNTASITAAEGPFQLDLTSANFEVLVGQGADTGDFRVYDGTNNWIFIDESADTLQFGDAATSISFNDANLTTAITLTTADSDFDSGDTAIVDAINTAYNTAVGAGGLWTDQTTYIEPSTSAGNFVITDAGNVGIGTTSPSSLLSVGSSSQFQVDSNGDIVSLGGVAHTLTDTSGDLVITSNADLIFDDSVQTSSIPFSDDDDGLNTPTSAIIDAINEAYAAATGGAGSFWSQTSGVLSPTTTSDDLAIGGTNSSSPFFVDDSGNVAAAGSITFSNLANIGNNNTVVTVDGSGVLQTIDTTTWDTDSSDDFTSLTLSGDTGSETLNSGNTLTAAGGTNITTTVTTTDTLTINLDDSIDLAGTLTVQNTSDLQGNVANSTGDLTIGDNLVVTGTSDLQSTIANSTGNLVLGDTTDIGSDTTGLRVDTSGNIIDIDGNVVIADTVDLGSASTGINITTTGAISDIDGDLTLDDDVAISGSLTLSAGATVNEIITDTSLAGATNQELATALAIKTYVDSQVGGSITAVGDITNGEAFTQTVPGSQLYFADTGFLGIGSTSERIIFDSTNGDISFLDANIGIGTTAPTGLLDVDGDLIVDTSGDISIFATDDLLFDDAQIGGTIQLSETDGSFTSGDTGIIDAINTAYSAATGGGGGLWSIASGVLYPTTATSDLAIGGTDANSPFYVNDSGEVTIGGSLTLASGSTVNAILDEDTLSSDSDTALATPTIPSKPT